MNKIRVIDWKKKRDNFLDSMVEASKDGDKELADKLLTMAAECNDMRYESPTLFGTS